MIGAKVVEKTDELRSGAVGRERLVPRDDLAEALDRSFGNFHVTVVSSGRRAQFFRCRLLALILVAAELPLVVRQVHQEPKCPDAIGADFLTVEDHRSVEKLTQIVPVELLALLEFLHQARSIKSIARLPELQHDEAAD